MKKKIILICPVCGRVQTVDLELFNQWVRHGGPPYTCGCTQELTNRGCLQAVTMVVKDVI